MSKELAEKLDSAAGAPPAARERFERARSMLVVADIDWEKRLETSQIRSEDGILNFFHITDGESSLDAGSSTTIDLPDVNDTETETEP
ncbi:hypothetical protein RYH80_10580 [Halobaculum sp. MBLA0147]|uniref:hypothetical protein n=1 Tax=Halobaculum sp. MBLA0147 TaxID=3079934 RepID=UPI0035264CAB